MFSPALTPVSHFRTSQVIHVQNISTLLHQDLPNMVSQAHWPSRRIPVSRFQALLVRRLDLFAQLLELLVCETATVWETDRALEVYGCVIAILVRELG